MQWAKKQTGFTIVELLIVVVVIAILAAITIVAYNGISSRAKASSAQTAASQGFKKTMAYAVDNAEQYPTTLAAAGVTNSGTTTYQYTVNNSSTPRTFCITATTQNVSYFVSQDSSTPKPGSCPGHGTNGLAAITNLVPNPTVESSAADWGYHPSNGTVSAGYNASDGYHGSSMYRVRWTAPNTDLGGGGGCYPRNIGQGLIEAGKDYTVSMYVRISAPKQMRMQVEWVSEAGTRVGTVRFSPTFNVAANTWTRIHHTTTAPDGVYGVVTPAYAIPGVLWQTDEYIDCDAAMVTEGSTLYPYADGSSTNWVWNGTPNRSSSTGSPL